MSFSNSGLDTRKYTVCPQTTPSTGTRKNPGSRVASWELALTSGDPVQGPVTRGPRWQLFPGQRPSFQVQFPMSFWVRTICLLLHQTQMESHRETPPAPPPARRPTVLSCPAEGRWPCGVAPLTESRVVSFQTRAHAPRAARQGFLAFPGFFVVKEKHNEDDLESHARDGDADRKTGRLLPPPAERAAAGTLTPLLLVSSPLPFV